MTVASQLADRLKGAIVVVNGNKMVPLHLAETAVLNVMRFETELEEARRRASDQSWALEGYRQQERENWVGDGQWPR